MRLREAQDLGRWLRDPRHLQIVVLSALCCYGIGTLDFEVLPGDAVLILASALGTQLLFSLIGARAPRPAGS